MNYFHPFATSNTPAAGTTAAARDERHPFSPYSPYASDGGGQQNPCTPYSPYSPYASVGVGQQNPYTYTPHAGGGVYAYAGGSQPSHHSHYSSYPPMPALGSGQIHYLPGAENWFSPSGVPRQIAPIDERVPLTSKPMNQYTYHRAADDDRGGAAGGGGGGGGGDVTAEEVVGLKKPKPMTKQKSSKGRTRGGSRTKKKSGQQTAKEDDDCIGTDAEYSAALKKPSSKTASTGRRSRAKDSEGFRTPAKPKASSSSSTRTRRSRAKSSDGFRTPTDQHTSTSANASNVLWTPATDIGSDWTIESVERGDYSKSSHKKKGQYYKYWHSPGGHKFRSKVEVGVFQEALVKLQGTDHEGDEDIAREMAKQTLCNKDLNGGLVITDAIVADAIEMAKCGDLDKARGHCIIVKRTCLAPGCTRHRKTGSFCRMHHEEEEKRKGKSAKKSSAKKSAVAASSSSSRSLRRRQSSVISSSITELNDEHAPPLRSPTNFADEIVEVNNENIPPCSLPLPRPTTPFAGDIVGVNKQNIPPTCCRLTTPFATNTFELDEDGIPPLPPPHLSPIEDVSATDQEEEDADESDKLVDEKVASNDGIGIKNDADEEGVGGQYHGDDESFDDGMPLLGDGSPVAKSSGTDADEGVLDESFFRLIDRIPNLPKTDDIPIDDITVSSLGSFREEVADPPRSPPVGGIPKSSPLKEANSSTRRLIIQDDDYVETITGPISEYGQHLEWVDEEESNLQSNRLDWGEVEGTPSPPKRTPTANSFGRMIQQKESTRQGTRIESAARGRRSPASGERLASVLDEVDDGALTPPRNQRRRSTRVNSRVK